MQQTQSYSDPSTITVSQQHMITVSDDSPSHLLEKQQQNFCVNNESQHFPVNLIMKSQFHRYSKSNDKRSSSNNQPKRQSKDIETSINRTLIKTASTKDCYIDWKVYKNKPDLNMLPFPYCIEQPVEYRKFPFSPLSLLNPFKTIQPKQPMQENKNQKSLPQIYKLKIENKIKIYNGYGKENKVSKPYFNFEKTPINEYLNYELAQEINTGLQEVQIMAEEIKRIKKVKKVANQNDLAIKEKYSKGLRIRRTNVKNFKGLYKTNNNI